jgi:hypothetical protein
MMHEHERSVGREEAQPDLDRWVATMPVLAGVVRGGDARCVLHGSSHGAVEHETEWGTLFRCFEGEDHFTLVEPRRA